MPIRTHPLKRTTWLRTRPYKSVATRAGLIAVLDGMDGDANREDGAREVCSSRV